MWYDRFMSFSTIAIMHMLISDSKVCFKSECIFLAAEWGERGRRGNYYTSSRSTHTDPLLTSLISACQKYEEKGLGVHFATPAKGRQCMRAGRRDREICGT
jgi:hypothetical protein